MRGSRRFGQKHEVAGMHHHAVDILATGLARDVK